MMNNPFFTPFNTPFDAIPFDRIRPEDYMPALNEAIRRAKADIDEIAQSPAAPTFANTIEALETTGRAVDLISTTLFNLNSAETSEALQAVAREASPILSAYKNDILFNEALFVRIKTLWAQREALGLDTEQQTLLEKTYKSFARNGANLSLADQDKLREIDQALAQATLAFGENVLGDTNEVEIVITDEQDLAGLPEDAIEAAKHTAQQRNKPEAWVFTLHAPSYMPVMMYARNRQLRKRMAEAYANRGCRGNERDNRKRIAEIARLRQSRAQLLGYASHADFTLEERMAGSVSAVDAFLRDMLAVAKPIAEQELAEVQAFAQAQDGLEQLERWDFGYYSEQLKKQRFVLDDNMLKPYFRLESVVQGVFDIVGKLYGVRFVERHDIPKYHPDVLTYEAQDHTGKHLALFYADFFPRAGKRDGAWMTYFRGQHATQRPHVSIVCNFTKPTPTKPSLLTFNEVTTLFHEFGHALHEMLSQCRYESLSGVSVYWDFVELPSQFFENWAYEKTSLDLFARHYETGTPIPAELIQRIKDAANYLSGYQTVRQIGFSLLDMAWHAATSPEAFANPEALEDAALAPTALFPKWAGTMTSAAFSHIFQGGYAAGYYSYKWAEVLEADAFELFQEKGMFDAATAQSFRENILARGGSEDPMVLYQRFRGQAPRPEALLRKNGLLKA